MLKNIYRVTSSALLIIIPKTDFVFYGLRLKPQGSSYRYRQRPSVSVGEYIKCSGIWYNDRNHGKQFKADFLKALPPDTLEGIEKYLGSGLIKGIGAHFAKKLVTAFGDKVFDVIEHKPELLSTLDGIGKIRANSILQ